MRPARTARVVSLLLIITTLCPLIHGKIIYVDDDGQADFDSIQDGIRAAEYGDTVRVAPGVYYENITLRDGISLLGAGSDVTIIDARGYADVVDARANNAAVCGFTLKNSGEFDSQHMNCGVYLDGTYAPTIKNNVIVGNRIGIGVWHGAAPDIRNNIIKDNSDGLYIYGSEERASNPSIINNTILNNENSGITLREMVSPDIVNNIIAGHMAGINHNYVSGSPTFSYNNLWRNDVNYMRDNRADDTLAGPGSTSVDPCFAKSGYWADINDPNATVEPDDPNAVWIEGDYHLKSQAGRYNPDGQMWVEDDVTSLCIDAGDPNSPVAFEPFPNGGAVNMGAYGGTAEASKSPSGLHARYGGGTGAPDDPYLIYTAEHLNALGAEPNDYDRHFKLMADIDLSGYSYDRALIAPDTNDAEWDFQGTAFSGVFDGNRRAVLYLTVTAKSHLGLFGQLGSGAEVKDLGVVDANITGSYYAVGGLVGNNFGGRITACYSTGTVTGYTHVGGLAGYNESGEVAVSHSTCMVSATLSGNQKIGGLVGVNAGRITTSYSTGAVSGQRVVGGLVGWTTGSISMCYSTGMASADQRVGGLVGDKHSDYSTVSGCFWDVETSGQSSSAGGAGKTTAEMQTASTFLDAGWDFIGETANGTEDIWWILEGKDYPRLWWEAAEE